MKILLTLCCFLSLPAFGAGGGIFTMPDGPYYDELNIYAILQSADDLCEMPFLESDLAQDQLQRGYKITQLNLKRVPDGIEIAIKFDKFFHKGKVTEKGGFSGICVRHTPLHSDASDPMAKTESSMMASASHEGLFTEATQLADGNRAASPMSLVSRDANLTYGKQGTPAAVLTPSAL